MVMLLGLQVRGFNFGGIKGFSLSYHPLHSIFIIDGLNTISLDCHKLACKINRVVVIMPFYGLAESRINSK